MTMQELDKRFDELSEEISKVINNIWNFDNERYNKLYDERLEVMRQRIKLHNQEVEA